MADRKLILQPNNGKDVKKLIKEDYLEGDERELYNMAFRIVEGFMDSTNARYRKGVRKDRKINRESL